MLEVNKIGDTVYGKKVCKLFTFLIMLHNMLLFMYWTSYFLYAVLIRVNCSGNISLTGKRGGPLLQQFFQTSFTHVNTTEDSQTR
jgi:hypothetical protein